MWDFFRAFLMRFQSVVCCAATALEMVPYKHEKQEFKKLFSLVQKLHFRPRAEPVKHNLGWGKLVNTRAKAFRGGISNRQQAQPVRTRQSLLVVAVVNWGSSTVGSQCWVAQPKPADRRRYAATFVIVVELEKFCCWGWGWRCRRRRGSRRRRWATQQQQVVGQQHRLFPTAGPRWWSRAGKSQIWWEWIEIG